MRRDGTPVRWERPWRPLGLAVLLALPFWLALGAVLLWALG